MLGDAASPWIVTKFVMPPVSDVWSGLYVDKFQAQILNQSCMVCMLNFTELVGVG